MHYHRFNSIVIYHPKLFSTVGLKAFLFIYRSNSMPVLFGCHATVVKKVSRKAGHTVGLHVACAGIWLG